MNIKHKQFLISSLILLIPLAYNLFAYNPFSIKLIIIDLFLLIIVGHGMLGQSKEKSLHISFDLLDVLLGLVLLLNILHLFHTPYGYAVKNELVSWIRCALLFYVLKNRFKELTDLRFFYRAWSVALIGMSLWAWIQFSLNFEKPYAGAGNPNFLASYIVMSVVILIGALFQPATLKKDKFSYLLSLILGLSVLIPIRSWGALMTMIGLVVLFLFMRVSRQKHRLLLFSAMGLILILLSQWDPVKNSFIEQIKYDIRPYLWEAALNMIREHPFLGFGPGTTFIYYPEFRPHEYFLSPLSASITLHLHNYVLELLVEWGVLGAGLIVSFMGIILYKFIKLLRFAHLSPDRWGIPFAVLALLIHNLVDVNLSYPVSRYLLWMLLALMGASFHLKIYRFDITKYKRAIYFCAIVTLLFFIQYELKVQLAQVYFKKGIEHRKEENWSRAIQYLERALALDPTDVKARYKLGYYYAQNIQFDEALVEYKSLKKMAPHFSDINRNMGTVYLMKGDSENALFYFKEQKKINPYDDENTAALVSVYSKLGQLQMAEKETQWLKKINPQHPLLQYKIDR